MSVWLEPIFKSALLIVALYTMAVYLMAIEQMAARYVTGCVKPEWQGVTGLLEPLREFLRTFPADSGESGMPANREDQPAAVRLRTVILLSFALLPFAAVPFGPPLPIGDGSSVLALSVAAGLEGGVLFVLAMSSLSLFGLVGSTSTQNEFDRATAFMANLVPVALCVVGAVLMSGTLRLDRMATLQSTTGMWWIALEPLGFAAFVLCLISAVGNIPASITTQKDSATNPGHGALFSVNPQVLAGWLHTVLLAYLLVLLYLGGGHFWWLTDGPEAFSHPTVRAFAGVCVLNFKAAVVIGWLIGFRLKLRQAGTTPFFTHAWKVAIPLALMNIFLTAACNEFLSDADNLVRAAISWSMLVVSLPVSAALYRRFHPV
jgi:NADH-quinone oxidoreductase subunit H